jgi:hypothetical protein
VKKTYFLILILITISFNCLSARGISTNYTDIFIENLLIGKEYNLTVLYNQPLKVTNTGNKPVKVVILVQIPQKDNLKSDSIPIPDANWITVFPDKYILEPHKTVESDIKIKIPKNKELRNKKMQVNFEIYGYPTAENKGITVVPVLLSKLRFSIKK